MSRELLIDTDVLFDVLRGHEKAVAYLGSHSHRILLSVVALAELYADTREPDEIHALDELVSLFEVVALTPEIVRTGAQYRRQYGASHGVCLADGLVAATALSRNAELKTLNASQYPMLKGLRAPYVKK